MTTINKQHGFYGALAAHYDSPDHRNAIWDITVKRLGQIHPEKSADEILEFLNGPAGNIFYLIGVCNRLVRELGVLVQLKREYETEINSANDYQSPPDHHAKMVWHCVCGITPKTILIYGNLFIRIQKNKKESP